MNLINSLHYLEVSTINVFIPNILLRTRHKRNIFQFLKSCKNNKILMVSKDTTDSSTMKDCKQLQGKYTLIRF